MPKINADGPSADYEGADIKELAAYFKRIGYRGDLKRNLETLTQVHRGHLLSIPYENIDVQLHNPVDMDIDRIYEKIVIRNRGGWCYEMNGLMEWALKEIGFDVKRVNGGVARSVRGDDAMGNHLVLLVDLGQTYIADVGFGDGVIDPIPLIEGPIVQRGFEFGLEHLPDGHWRFHNHKNGGAPSFDFREDPADEQLFGDKCQFLQTSRESPFVMAFITQLFVSGGYEIQLGQVARSITREGIETRVIQSETEFLERLRCTFRLDVSALAGIWPKIVARHNEMLDTKIPAS